MSEGDDGGVPLASVARPLFVAGLVASVIFGITLALAPELVFLGVLGLTIFVLIDGISEFSVESTFTVFAGLLTTISLIAYIPNVAAFDSWLSNAAIIFVVLAGVFAITQRTRDDTVRRTGYATIVVTGLPFAMRLPVGDSPETLLSVVGLLTLAALLYGVPRLALDDDDQFVAPAYATYGFLLTLLAGSILVVVDLLYTTFPP
jgi:hypothetical protein